MCSPFFSLSSLTRVILQRSIQSDPLFSLFVRAMVETVRCSTVVVASAMTSRFTCLKSQMVSTIPKIFQSDSVMEDRFNCDISELTVFMLL